MVRTLLSHCNVKDNMISLGLGVKDSLEGANENIILKNVPEVGSGQTCNTLVIQTVQLN